MFWFGYARPMQMAETLPHGRLSRFNLKLIAQGRAWYASDIRDVAAKALEMAQEPENERD
jgi:hypothetical protein